MSIIIFHFYHTLKYIHSGNNYYCTESLWSQCAIRKLCCYLWKSFMFHNPSHKKWTLSTPTQLLTRALKKKTDMEVVVGVGTWRCVPIRVVSSFQRVCTWAHISSVDIFVIPQATQCSLPSAITACHRVKEQTLLFTHKTRTLNFVFKTTSQVVETRCVETEKDRLKCVVLLWCALI